MVRFLVDELHLDLDQLDGDEYCNMLHHSDDMSIFLGPPINILHCWQIQY